MRDVGHDYDVIVVGAGPAGCAAAYDLARANRRVLLLDRFTFPRVKPCAGAVTIKAVKALRYPIGPVVREVATTFAARKRDERPHLLPSRRPICALTVRSEFDRYCLERTIEAGAEFRTIGHIAAIDQEPESVGIVNGERSIRARFLIGADGANSRVRQLTTADAWPRNGFAVEIDCARPLRDIHLEFDFGVVDGGYGWVFPKGDHVNAGLYTYKPDVRLTRAQLDDYVERRVGTAPIGRMIGHRVGLGGAAYRPNGRVLLAGDAAGLTDPLLGEGIYNAIRSGQAAAAAIIKAPRHGVSVSVEYARRLLAIQQDIGDCELAATRFYRNLDRGYAMLTRPFARYSFVKGYSLGLTFSATKRWAVLLPLVPVLPVKNLGRRARTKSRQAETLCD